MASSYCACLPLLGHPPRRSLHRYPCCQHTQPTLPPLSLRGTERVSLPPLRSLPAAAAVVAAAGLSVGLAQALRSAQYRTPRVGQGAPASSQSPAAVAAPTVALRRLLLPLPHPLLLCLRLLLHASDRSALASASPVAPAPARELSAHPSEDCQPSRYRAGSESPSPPLAGGQEAAERVILATRRHRRCRRPSHSRSRPPSLRSEHPSSQARPLHPRPRRGMLPLVAAHPPERQDRSAAFAAAAPRALGCELSLRCGRSAEMPRSQSVHRRRKPGRYLLAMGCGPRCQRCRPELSLCHPVS